jgi:predicted MFS family arabinose efflux permease
LSEANPHLVVAAVVAATISTVFPGFAVGALSVQMSEEFGVGEAKYGWALGSFFLAAAAGSVVTGRAAQRFGPRRQITFILLAAVAVQLAIALAANSFAGLVGAMLLLGFLNSGNQTAINLAISQAQLPRLGLAISIKQSGMPAAAMLSGLAVPALALTVGWRWAYVGGAALALAALVAVRLLIVDVPDVGTQRRGELGSSRSSLVTLAVASGFLAFCAGALTAWIVGSGVDAGLGEGGAGLVLSFGAGLGILVRMSWGFRLDSITWRPLLGAGAMMLLGSAGFGLLILGSSTIHVFGALLAFGAGWIWPVFTNFAIVRVNPVGAARATGITQMGVYVGVFSGPLVGGWVIGAWGYSAMWFLVMIAALIGSVLVIRVSSEF